MEWIHGNYNLAYEAMKALGIHEKEFDIYLNISGTVIHTIDEEENEKFVFYKPKIEEALNLFLYGKPFPPSIEEDDYTWGGAAEEEEEGEGSFHKFVLKNGTIPGKGLNLITTNTLASPFIGGRVNKIQSLLGSILEKINKERSSSQTLSDEEVHFLGSSSFPIEALLNLMGQNQGKTVSHHFSLYDFAKLLAIEEIATYIGTIGNRMLQAFQKLKFKLGLAKGNR